MKNILLAIAIALPLSLFAAQMDANGIVTKQSHVDVKTTIDRLEKMIKQKGITLFNRIDHRGNAKKAGGAEMGDAELIIFGKPNVGLKMMTKDPKAGLDLPLKMLAYKAKDGKVYLSYRDVAFYGKIYDLEGCKVPAKMSKMLNMLSNKATMSPEDFKAFVHKSKKASKSPKQ